MKKKILIILLNVLSLNVIAQNILSGSVKDDVTKETLPGVKVTLDGANKVTMTDFDGNFKFTNVPEGTYKLSAKYATYVIKTVENVQVKNGEQTKLDITLISAVIEQQEVVVRGILKKDSEASVLLERKNAAIVTDGISSQSIKKSGDSDVSGAAKRITGVTIRNGKYIYVRGLGDRYTQTTLNGLVIPGLDPDINAIQLDIFPTSIIDNLNIAKTASAELYGDFAGGLVNIATKKFPAKKSTQIGFGFDFNPNMHFRNDFLTYTSSSTDWLGFDNGQRTLPSVDGKKISSYKVPDEVRADPLLESVTRSFNKELAAKTKTSLPNGSFSISHGNNIKTKDSLDFGYFTSFNYSNENIFYKDYETNEYLKNDNLSENNLVLWSGRKGNIGKNSVMWSALGSGSVKFKKNTIQFTALHLQNGESSAMLRTSNDYNNNVSTIVENILSYSSRSLTSFLLSGNHSLSKKLTFDWGNAFSLSNVNEPDFRETKISVTNGDTTLSTGTGAGIDRFWREINELTESAKGDFTYKFGEKTNLKAGLSGTYKSRDFSVFAYRIRTKNLSDVSYDPDWYLTENQIWTADTRNTKNGTYTIGNFEPTNNFSANQNTLSTYLVFAHPIKKFLNLSYGVRVEKFAMFYTGQNNSGSIKMNNEQTMDELNILPSANLNFILNDKMNVRIGAGNTVARPSFKEKSIAQIYDPITKRIFNGNIDLKQTNIFNVDSRYEFFLSNNELIAISGFYKRFDGHIEMVSIAAAPTNLMPRNSGLATMLGTEIEFRKNFAKKEVSKFWNQFSANMNLSLVSAKVDLKSVIVDNQGQTEHQLRTINRRINEPEIAATRPMAGQSPYSINFGLSYDVPEKETNISLSYNIQGPQLTIISSGRIPDVYTDPFNSLNINAFRSFGKNKKSKITLGVQNILNDRTALVYKSYGAQSEIYSSYNPGIQFSFKYNYNF